MWRLRLLAQRGIGEFMAAGGTRLAAAISYYALLSIAPLFLMLVAGADLVLGEGDARDEVVDRITNSLPLTDEGQDQVREILEAVGGGAGAVGLVGLIGLLWSASGMMGAIRTGITHVSGDETPRPFILGKLIDLAMVLLTGGLLLASAALTVTMRVAGDEVLGRLGIPGTAALVGIAAPLILTFLTLTLLLRFVPANPVGWGGAWRAALGGSLALWLATSAFAFYVDNFGRYNVVYGSLGAVVIFMLFVFIAALILLLTAAAAGAWAEIREMDHPPQDNPYAPPASVRVRGFLRGLVSRRRGGT